MANRKISDFTALTAPASSDVLPIIDISESAAADKNKKITYANLLSKAPDGAAGTPSISFLSDQNSGISGGADTLTFSTGGIGRLTISSAGLVTIGGSLKVGGTTTTINSVDISTKDRNIHLAKVAAASFTGNIAAGAATITELSTTDNLAPGVVVTLSSGGENVTLGSGVKVVTVDSTTQVTLDTNFGGSGTATGATLAAGGPTNVTADGGGLTLEAGSDTDKTFNWVSTTSSWTSSENLNLASGKVLKIAGTQVLSATQYTGNAATASSVTNLTVAAESTDTSCSVVFTTGPSGALPPKTATTLTFNSNTGALTATSFVGALTGNVTGNASGSSGSCTGNAATATALATARTIGGVSFDGSANIDLPGVNAAGNQSTSGNAATATEATNVTVTANNSTDETVYPVFVAGATGTQGAETDSGLTYNPSSGLLTSTSFAGALTGNVTGNCSGTAATVTGAAQTNITSVGTLTGLTVSGDILMSGTGCIDVPAGTTGQRPGSANTGMFRYNSTTSQFEGYTASGWGAIAGGGGGSTNTDFQYLALRNAANNGAASYPGADFTLVTSGTTSAISPTAANALLVSYGGVIQQPNTGTSTPTTGFAISGSTIKFGSNIAAAPDFIIYQKNAGIGTPSDETVTEAKLDANAPTNDYVLTADSTASSGFKWAATGVPTSITVAAESTDTSCSLLFATAASGNLAPKTATTLTFNSNTGALTATSFVGALTGNVTGNASGSSGSCTGNAATATTSGHVTVTDNENTNENNLIPFVEDAASSTGSHGLEMDGDFHYNPSTGTVTATAFAGSGANLTGIASTSLDGCGYQNDQTISSGTYTIAAGKGMHSVGPITNNGTVTVNGVWVIS